MSAAFEAARDALAPDGPKLFAFTTERMASTDNAAEKGWSILGSGRFCHTREYLCSLAEENGFGLVHYEGDAGRGRGGLVAPPAAAPAT